MQTETAQDLLEAVGVEWKDKWSRLKCPECSTSDARLYHNNNCRRPSTRDLPLTYTGPALGTPELDALLLVAGQRWCVENWDKYDDVNDALYDGNLQAINETDTFVLEWLLFYCDTPGHALARAIREVGKA